MKKLAAFGFALASMLAPAALFACPTAASAQDCCGSQLGQYASTFGIGLLIGVGSVAVESALRSRKK